MVHRELKSLSIEEDFKMERIHIRPAGGDRNNKVAATLHTLAIVVWFAGGILGLYIGYKWGEMQGFLRSFYESDQSEFSWSTACIVWWWTFISGLIPYAFSEIIYLLQSLNNNSYFIEGFEESYSDKEKKGKDDDRGINGTAAFTDTGTQDDRQKPQYDEVSVDEFLHTLSGMRSATEIKKYVDDLEAQGVPIVNEKLKGIVHISATIEKSYGNDYDSCMRKICSLYGYEYEKNKEDERVEAGKTMETEQTTPVADEPLGFYDDEPKEAEYYFCTNCGNKIDESDAVFCPVCGNKIIRW